MKMAQPTPNAVTARPRDGIEFLNERPVDTPGYYEPTMGNGNAPPSVSVVVPTLDRAARIVSAIRAILDDAAATEVVVVEAVGTAST